MDNLKEFKAFLKTIPSIKEDVLNHRYTWQEIYEIYKMYGEDDTLKNVVDNVCGKVKDVLDYIRKHPVWYVTLCHYPEKYDDLLDEIHQKKQSTVLEKLERISILMSMLEMLQ